MTQALPRSAAMYPVIPKIPVPTMFEMTSAVALNRPSWRSSPGLSAGAGTLSMFHHLRTVADHALTPATHKREFSHSLAVAKRFGKSEDGKSRYDATERGAIDPSRADLDEPPRRGCRLPRMSA